MLRQTIKELEQTPNSCLVLYYNPKEKGIQIEVRDHDGGNLLSQPFVLKDTLIQEQGPIDLVDESSAKILRNVRLLKKGGGFNISGRN